MELLAADRAVLSASAARVTRFRSATATKTRSYSKVMERCMAGRRRHHMCRPPPASHASAEWLDPHCVPRRVGTVGLPRNLPLDGFQVDPGRNVAP